MKVRDVLTKGWTRTEAVFVVLASAAGVVFWSWILGFIGG